MKVLALLATLASLTLALPAATVRYDNQQVVRLPFNAKTYAAARALHMDIFGKSPRGLDVRVESPTKLKQLLAAASVDETSVQVLDANIQASIDEERKRLATKDHEAAPVGKTPAARLADYFSEYHKYEEINQFCKDLASTYSSLVTFVPSIGKSGEGRDLFQIKITGKGDATNKPRIWLHSLQHAREWIGGATSQYIAHYLVSNYGKDPRVTKLVDDIEWVITPVVNPDGYVYTWTKDRMWRKNKRVENGRLVGVDTNRNWPFKWGLDSGSSGDSSDEDYRGPSAASEPEVQVMIKAFRGTPNIAASIDFHSYQESILRPWGYSTSNEVTPDEAQFVAVANKMMASVKATTKRGSNYNSLTQLYPVSGSVRDYFYSNDATAPGASKVYSFTVELSPNGRSSGNGFILPPSEIVKVGAEWAVTILGFAEQVTANRLGPKKED